MQKKDNNYAFIDSQNLYKAIEEQGWSLDYSKFRTYLRDMYGITKAYLFIGYIHTNQRLYITLQQQDYVLVFKPTLVLPSGHVKGNVDAELVLHAMIEYDNYDKAVIVTGDGDFHCLVDYFIQQDKLAKLVIPDQRKFSSLYRKMMPHITFLNNAQQKLGKK